MAAPIDLSGAGSLEEQLYSAALAMQQAELAVPIDTRPDNTSVTFDTEGATVAVAVTLDTTLSVSGGVASISVSPYLA